MGRVVWTRRGPPKPRGRWDSGWLECGKPGIPSVTGPVGAAGGNRPAAGRRWRRSSSCWRSAMPSACRIISRSTRCVAYQEALAGFVDANPVLAPLAYFVVLCACRERLLSRRELPHHRRRLPVRRSPRHGAGRGGGARSAPRSSSSSPARRSATCWLRRPARAFSGCAAASRRKASATCFSCASCRCFPFWLVNLAAALFGMRVLPYVTATAIGIVPGTFVYSYFGQGLGARWRARGRRPRLSSSWGSPCSA